MDEFSLSIMVEYLLIFLPRVLVNFDAGRIDKPMTVHSNSNAKDADEAMIVGAEVRALHLTRCLYSRTYIITRIIFYT